MLAEDHDSQGAVPNAVSETRHAVRRRVAWMVGIVTVVLSAVIVAFRLWNPSTELELEIGLDLIANGQIDADTRVFVLNETRLYSFYSRYGPRRFATLCLRQSGGDLSLAYAQCWREGMLWRTDSERWQKISTWPSDGEIRAFENGFADVFQMARQAGYLPRPPGTANFQLTHASVATSEGRIGFDPNNNVDPVVLGAVLRNGFLPGPYTFAEFHDQRWHPPEDGIHAIDQAMERLQPMLNQPECQAMDCDSFVSVLRAVRDNLRRAGELNLKFCFLAADRSAE